MANLPADLPENWTQGQIVSPNGTEVGLSEQHGYNYLMHQVNATQTEINNINTGLSGVAQEDTLQSVADKIGNTTDTGATDSTGTVMGKLNGIYNKFENGVIKSVQRGVLDKTNITTYDDYGRYCDVTISAVNISKSFLIVNSSSETYNANAKLLNSKTIRFYQTDISSSSNASFSNYNWQVIEFN